MANLVVRATSDSPPWAMYCTMSIKLAGGIMVASRKVKSNTRIYYNIIISVHGDKVDIV